MFSFESAGDFKNTESFLKKMLSMELFTSLDSYGRQGVAALSSATPVDSSVTAGSWGYEIRRSSDQTEIIWTNSNLENGFPVAVMLQYGHGTGTGGYVQGQDYINPAIKPIMDKIADGVWKAVKS